MALLTGSIPHRNFFQDTHNPLGLGAMMLTVLIWSGWVVSTKVGINLSLAPFDIALLRYGFPGVIFGYFTYKSRHIIYKTKLWQLLCICLGAGLPFLFLVAWGMELAPASHAGVLVPGTFPLFVTLIVLVRSVMRRSANQPCANHLVGMAVIFLGVLVLIIPAVISPAGYSMLKGYGFYLLGAFCWSLYTVAVSESQIPALAAAGLFSLFATLLSLFLYLIGAVDSNFTQILSSGNLPTYYQVALVQSVLVGTLASYCYLFAVHALGTEKTMILSSFTPVVVVIMSTAILKEPLDLITCAAVGIVCCGIAVTSYKAA